MVGPAEVIRMFTLLTVSKIRFWLLGGWGFNSEGNKIPMAFYLFDAEDREFDVHVAVLDDNGNTILQWAVADKHFSFTREDLTASGIIDSISIPCITPEKQVLVHQGYELPATHLADRKHLQEKFGVVFPDAGNS